MLTLDDLNGSKVKSEVDAIDRMARRWHNNNKNGGNFGYDIDLKNFDPQCGGLELTGNYDKQDGEKVLTKLRLSMRYTGHGVKVIDLPASETDADLYMALEHLVKQYREEYRKKQ